MIVIDVTEIYEDIAGHAGVCFPSQDADGKYILGESALQDGLLAAIWEQIDECPRIEYKPKKINI